MIDLQKIIKDYSKLKSVWKVGELNGLTGQRVHSILKKNNIEMPIIGKWTKEQETELITLYNTGFLSGDNDLDNFCKKHGKLKSNVCRKAKILGLSTNYKRKSGDKKRSKISFNAKKWIKEKGHPKGMLGKTHSDEFKKIASAHFKKMWKDPDSFFNTDEYRQGMSDRSSINMNKRLRNNGGNMYSRTKNGTIEIGGRSLFVRSSWEANITAYFQFLKDNGTIKDWEYEPKTFWFLNIKRGVRSYRPDFLITENNGYQYFEEVKGWMDAKSKTKISRMAKYYPEVDLRILDKKRYSEISKISPLIPNWGLLG